MLQRTYSRQKEKTKDKVWSKAKEKAEGDHQHPTAEEFVDHIKERIKESNIEIFNDYVPVEFDKKRDEVYYSQEKIPRIGRTNDSVWFLTESDEALVRYVLSEILNSYNVNLGIVSTENEKDDVTRYDIKIPFISEEKRQKNIREDTVKYARDIRKYKDIDEDNIVGDCPNDDCDGKQYRNGMGSCGPKYECNRFGCGFQFVKDVL